MFNFETLVVVPSSLFFWTMESSALVVLIAAVLLVVVVVAAVVSSSSSSSSQQLQYPSGRAYVAPRTANVVQQSSLLSSTSLSLLVGTRSSRFAILLIRFYIQTKKRTRGKNK